MDWRTFYQLRAGDIVRHKRTRVYWVVTRVDQDSISLTELLDAGRDGNFTEPEEWEFVRRPSRDTR